MLCATHGYGPECMICERDTLRREVSRLREAMRAALDEAAKLDGPRSCRIAVLLTDALREE